MSFHEGCEALVAFAGVAFLVLGEAVLVVAFLVVFFSLAAVLPFEAGAAAGASVTAGVTAGATSAEDIVVERREAGLERLR